LRNFCERWLKKGSVILSYPLMSKIEKSNAKLAKIWGCTARTIARWRKDKAPFDDKDAMQSWLTARKNLPSGTRALLSGNNGAKISAAVEIEDETSPGIGAASALRRLEAIERALYKTLEAALKAGDPSAIKSARENWLAVGNQLRQYDRQVERDRRTAGELIPKAEIEKHAKALAYFTRRSMASAADSLSTVLPGMNPMEAGAALRQTLWENFCTTLAALSSKDSPSKLPGWFVAAAIHDLECVFADPQGIINERRIVFEALFDEAAKVMAAVKSQPISG
jgi:hypothetical protein